MADIYLDPVNGVDSNDGSSGNPVRTLPRAIWQATSGDTILVSNASISTPLRAAFDANQSFPAGVTMKPLVATDRIYISSAIKVNEGDIYENGDERVSYHSGIGASVTGDAAWDEHASATYDTTASDNLWGGAGTLQLNAAGQYTRKTILITNRKCRFRIAWKAAIFASLNGGWQQEWTDDDDFGLGGGGTTNRYMWNPQTGLWDSDASFYDWKDANGVDLNSGNFGVDTWVESTTAWIERPTSTASYNSHTPDGGSGAQVYFRAGGGQINIQYIIMEIMSEWTEVSTDVYNLPYLAHQLTTSVTGRNNPVGGDTSVSGVWYATNLTDYTTYRISENDTASPDTDLASYWDSGNSRMRFKVPSGANLSDYNLYICATNYPIFMEGATGGGTIINPTIIIGLYGFRIEGSAAWTIYDLQERATLVGAGIATETSTLTINDGANSIQPVVSSYSKEYGGGFLCGVSASADVATMNIYGGYVRDPGDDGYQPIGAGVMNIYGGISIDPNGNDIEVNGDNSPDMTIRNFSGTKAFRDQSPSTTTVDMENCSFPSIQMNGNQTRTYTVGSANYCEAATVSYSGGATAVANLDNNVNFSATLGYTSSTDLTPTTSSDLWGTGVKWWDGTEASHPVGGNGEPFSEWDTDAGGIQSTTGPFHPKNL